MKQQRTKSKANRTRQAGQGIVEYLIIISLVALAIVIIVNVMQPVIGGVFSDFVANARVAPPELVGFTRVAPTATATPDTELDLTVNLLPDPTYGNVTQNPIGPTYNFGTVVTLQANRDPAFDYAFSHWSGDLDTTDNPAQITMDEDKTVDAVFVPCYTVTANATAGGSVNVDPAPNCDGKYSEGTELTFTANPQSGYVFDDWSGALSGTTNPETLTVSGDHTVTANFAASTSCYTLTTNKTPSDGGVVTVQTSPNCGSNQYNAGTDVTITASPADGYEFGDWSDDASGTDPMVTIDMNGNKTVTANFVPETYEITLNVSGSGSVSKSPDQATYDPGDVVRLTASPAAGWEFDGWTGDASGSSLNYDLTMDSDKTVNAFFGQICYTLTPLVAPDGTGSVSVSPAQNCSGGYTAGTNITLEALPNGGYDFDQWSGDVTGSTNPETFTINDDQTVTANFVESSVTCYSLTTDVDPGGGGSVSVDAPNCDGDRYQDGTVVGITASPATGHEFNSWSGDLVSGNASETITMNSDKSVTAEFDPLCYDVTLTASPAAGGAVVASPAANCGGGQYAYGTDVTFTANPNSGYDFDGWSGDLSGFTNPDSLAVESDVSVIANFSSAATLDSCEYEESGGIIVIEAEHYYDIDNPGSGAANDSVWSPVTSPGGYVGGYAMEAQPNDGVIVGDSANGPRLDYHIDFETTGDYYIWVRGYGSSGGDDSIHVGFGSPHTYGGTGLTGFDNNYEWQRWNDPISVSATGLQTLSAWMREDGFIFDRIALVKTDADAGLSNGSTASGPAESSAPAGCDNPPILLDATFDSGSESFSYQDDAFRGTNEPGYASGDYDGNDGNPDGSLRVELGGIDGSDIDDMSGGWQTTFTLSAPGAVSVAFDYSLEQDNDYESNEYSEVLVMIDGVLYGAGSDDYVDRINGGGDTGWENFSFTTGSLSAGTHTITIGGFNNQKTTASEDTTIYIDNVFVLAD